MTNLARNALALAVVLAVDCIGLAVGFLAIVWAGEILR